MAAPSLESASRTPMNSLLRSLRRETETPAADRAFATPPLPHATALPALLAGAILLFALLRLAIASSLGLTDDEAYYRLWSLAPALSYLDHPPMVAWLIAAGRAVAGDGELGVRLLAPVLLALGALLQWRMALRLTNPATATRAAWLFLAVPLLNVGGIIITPDLPSVLFYGLVILGLAELDRTQNANWWLGIGLFAGLGLLSKYTNLFAGGTILLWLLAAPSNRKWFASPQLWLGGFLAILVFSPVLVWNDAHDWASFAKQFGRVADAANPGPRYMGEMIAGLALLLSPVIAVFAAQGLRQVGRTAWQKRDSRSVLIIAGILPLLGYFLFHALHGRVQANWLSPIYPLLALCAAVALENAGPRLRRTGYGAALACGFLMTAAIYTHALTPLVALRKDPTGQMRGWSELTKSLQALAEANGVRWIVASSYATTGQLTYALRHALPVAQLNEPIRHEHLPPLAHEAASAPALYVELERRSSEPLLARCFKSFSRIATIARADATPSGAPYAVYLVHGLQKACPQEGQSLRSAPQLRQD